MTPPTKSNLPDGPRRGWATFRRDYGVKGSKLSPDSLSADEAQE